MTNRSFRIKSAWLSLVVATSFACGSVQAQDPLAELVGDGGEPEETYARDSPRASIVHFLSLARSGDYEAAAGYLETLPADAAEAPELARKLQAVLDRRVWVEVEALSPLSTGNTEDGLPANTDEVGQIENERAVPEPVRIVRRRHDKDFVWLFSRGTVSRIDTWYAALDDKWLLEHIPPVLLRTGPRSLMWWQWLALPALILASWGLALLLSAISTRVMAWFAARSRVSWDDVLVQRLRKPVALWWALAVIYCCLPFLALYAPAERFVLAMLKTLFFVGFFFALSGIIDVAADSILRSSWSAVRQTSGSLISLGSRLIKAALTAIAVVAILSQLGFPIASVLAGLGVGGLALALAAQKTVENLFGAFSIGADQPFREGDLVKVGDFTGTCELIGLRSTRFRTPDRTVISIPNGKLAEMQLETYARRDRLRFAITLGLVRTSSAAQVRAVITGVKQLLDGQHKLYPGSAAVRFEKYGPSSLDLSVEAYIDTRDWGEFANIRQELLLRIMEIVEGAGTALALQAAHVQLIQPSPGLELQNGPGHEQIERVSNPRMS
ncbi:MAG TPA: mechanosensitive ion channel family protein [Polyangiales bacterium]|nr:mechanosensitive ion channel family protein [Polyangiales bacterium]